jgi:hypothetical protein
MNVRSQATRVMLSAAFLSVLGCSAAPESVDTDSNTAGDEIGALSQPVQWNAQGRYQIDTTNTSQVEGYLTYKAKDGNYWPTCGLTFVSKHFAITAAHCVKNQRVDNDNVASSTDDKITVLQFDVRNIAAGSTGGPWAALSRLYSAAQVVGSWPNYTRPNPQMACSVGYCITMADFDCRVRFRCGSTNAVGCPAGATGDDIAVVHCPNRSANSPYAQVATSTEALNNLIDIHSYHEILDMPSQPGEAVGPADALDHYTLYIDNNNLADPHSKLQNYHYQRPGQLMPLLHASFPNGPHYKIVDMSTTGAFSDAYVCHGTSGSGAFLANTSTLIGPVLGGGSSGRLCLNPAEHTPGSFGALFLRAHRTRALEALVLSDR